MMKFDLTLGALQRNFDDTIGERGTHLNFDVQRRIREPAQHLLWDR
jgi:hypothetical protein